MPADEVRHENSAAEFRERTGPRHAAPRKHLFNRLHMPAGKAIAIAAMPTAVLMGMGLTPTLAQAKDNPTKFSADDYKACADAIKASEDGKDAAGDKGDESASPTPSPSASASKDTSDGKADSGDKAEPTPSPSASKSTDAPSDDSTAGSKTATPTPTPTETKNPLDPLGVGDALKDLLTPDQKESATPTPSASASKSTDVGGTVKDTVDKVTKPVKDTTDKVGDTVKDTVDKAGKAVDDTAGKVTEVVPTPSAGETGVPDNCPAATDAEGGNEQTPAQVPNDSWRLEASSLTLKGADYQGIVNVRTPNGTVKKVLKYVISDGTDIGDLHQTVVGPDGKTYHVQAGKGTTSTIRGGKTTMYTESISGNLLGLIPITFDAEHPPPLNIPLIYFTNVKVQQAGQFGGNLHVPGLHQYLTG